MHTYAISNQKGGVGKTTTALNLAIGLARKGKRTLLIDLDPQANASYAILAPREPGPTVYQVLIDKAAISDAVCTTSEERLDMLPADIDLAGAEIDLLSAIGVQTRLRARLADLADRYDYAVIDTPPSLGLLTINALAACDEVIIPVSVSLFAMKGLAQLSETISRVQESLNHPKLRIRGILATLCDRTKRSREVLLTLKEHFPGQIFETAIPKNVTVEEAHGRGKSLYDYAPGSKGAMAYERFVEEVIGHV